MEYSSLEGVNMSQAYLLLCISVFIISIGYSIVFLLTKDPDKKRNLARKIIVISYIALLMQFFGGVVKYTLVNHVEGVGILWYVYIMCILSYINLGNIIHLNKLITNIALYGGIIIVLSTQYMYTYKVNELFGIKIPIEYNKVMKE